MKLKRLPEDFQVEELTAFAPGAGPFALYRLTKRSLGTPEVIDAVVRRWDIARRRISFGGLKDRHALTRQFVTIERGPRHDLRQTNFDLAYLGQADRPFQPKDIQGNRFSIVLRDLSPEALAQAEAALQEVARDGLPNYFDDQRFGSVGESGEFIAQAWVRENYERALWLALADPNDHDRPDDREQKKLLRDGWGDWTMLKAKLDRSHARSIICYLADHPADFKGALARIHKEERSLWLAAFQSHVWNHVLAGVLRDTCAPAQLVPVALKTSDVPFYRSLEEPQRRTLLAARIPFPSARAKIDDPAMKARMERALGDELRKMRIRHPKDSFFSRGERPALVMPAELSHESADDELYPPHRKLTLRFDLPRGSYATILVKRLFQVSSSAPHA